MLSKIKSKGNTLNILVKITPLGLQILTDITSKEFPIKMKSREGCMLSIMLHFVLKKISSMRKYY